MNSLFRNVPNFRCVADSALHSASHPSDSSQAPTHQAGRGCVGRILSRKKTLLGKKLNKTLKWILIAVVLAVVGNVAKESMNAHKEADARIAFKNICQRQAQKSASIPPNRVEAVCSCVIDKTVKSLGQAGFSRIAMVTNAKESDIKVLNEAMATCMDENSPPK